MRNKGQKIKVLQKAFIETITKLRVWNNWGWCRKILPLLLQTFAPLHFFLLSSLGPSLQLVLFQQLSVST